MRVELSVVLFGAKGIPRAGDSGGKEAVTGGNSPFESYIRSRYCAYIPLS